MGKIHQDYRVFYFSFFFNSYPRSLTSISSKMFQHDAFYIRPNHFISIQFIISRLICPHQQYFNSFFIQGYTGVVPIYVCLSHIYYFVMLLINLKFCIMRFLSEVIPLIPVMLPFKNILDRGRHFDPLSGLFSEQLNKEKTQDNYQNLKNVPNFRKGGVWPQS